MTRVSKPCAATCRGFLMMVATAVIALAVASIIWKPFGTPLRSKMPVAYWFTCRPSGKRSGESFSPSRAIRGVLVFIEDEDEDEEFDFGSTKFEPSFEGSLNGGSASNFLSLRDLPDARPASADCSRH